MKLLRIAWASTSPVTISPANELSLNVETGLRGAG